MKYKSYGHAKTFLRYHIIFSTKYRRKCLEHIENEVIKAFQECEKVSAFKILKIGIDKDHIHLLVKCKPRFSIEQIVRRMKQMTTKYIYDNCLEHIKKFYWKQKRILWTHGYFVSTIGEVSEENITKYIENQG